ncbi:hypothetical protein BOTBODRAFT_178350 [Botryobasidium botryosum FD-172 SS1]|uniref:Uncharacterized protein n=1 Tax=Botryobasidium botryosum (strain FD-172 SS1) TaxID=930990 RepID=A0A067M614_BOTB1|nr:hypothetical protein BOTBODRAFT_178350 [Botryobasidium botryosum FD-172 SS1]
MDLGEGDLPPHAQDAHSTRNSTRDRSAPSLSERKLPSRSCSHDVGINKVGISLPTDRLTRLLSVDQNHGAPPPYASNVYAGAGTQDRIGVFEGEEDATARPKHTEREKQPREGPRPLVLQSSHTAIKRAASRSPTVPARTPELYKGDPCPSIHITQPSSDSDREIGPQERAPVLHGDYPCFPSPHTNDRQDDNPSVTDGDESFARARRSRSARKLAHDGSVPSPGEGSPSSRSYSHDTGVDVFGASLPNDWLTRVLSLSRDSEPDAPSTRLFTPATPSPTEYDSSYTLHREWQAIAHETRIYGSSMPSPRPSTIYCPESGSESQINGSCVFQTRVDDLALFSTNNRESSYSLHCERQFLDRQTRRLDKGAFGTRLPTQDDVPRASCDHNPGANASNALQRGSNEPLHREKCSESRSHGSCAFKTRFDDFASFSIDEHGLPPSLHYEWQSVDRQTRAIGTNASRTRLSTRDEVPRSSNGHGAGIYASNASFTGYSNPSHTDSMSDSRPLGVKASYTHLLPHGKFIGQPNNVHNGVLDTCASSTRSISHAGHGNELAYSLQPVDRKNGVKDDVVSLLQGGRDLIGYNDDDGLSSPPNPAGHLPHHNNGRRESYPGLRTPPASNDLVIGNHTPSGRPVLREPWPSTGSASPQKARRRQRGRSSRENDDRENPSGSQAANGEDNRENGSSSTRELNELLSAHGDHDDDAGHRSATPTSVLVPGTDACKTRLSVHDGPVAATISDDDATHSLHRTWQSAHRENGSNSPVLDFYGGRNPTGGIDSHQNAENESITRKMTNDDDGEPPSSLCLAGRSPHRDNGLPRPPHSSQVAYTPLIKPNDQDNDVERRLVNSHDRDCGAPSSSAGISGEISYSLHDMGQPTDHKNGVNNDVLGFLQGGRDPTESTAHGDDDVVLGHFAFNMRPSAHDDPAPSTTLNGELSNLLHNAWQAVDGVDHAVSDFSQGGRDPADRAAFIETAHFGGGIVITVRGRATAPL